MAVTDTAGSIRLSSPTGRGVVLTTVLGSGMAMLDGTVVNVALPRLGADLGASLASLQWVINAYMLMLAGLILLGGSLGDHYGRRKVFLTGVVWFALASALCGLAPNVGVLIAARALQGVGGALLTPGSLALIQATFREDDRARAVGAWSGLGGVATAIGPFLGGWLVDGPGWRWVFLINLPMAALVIIVAVRYVPESKDETAHGHFDVPGAALAALALAGVTYALVAAPNSGASPLVISMAVAGILLGIAFVQVERRHRNPMLPLEVFRSGVFTWVNVVTFGVYGALGGTMFLFSVELQNVAGYTPLQSGISFLPVTALLLTISARAGQLAQQIGPRLQLTVGPMVAAAGLVLFTRIGPHASYVTDVLPGVLLLGLGMSALVAPLTATVLASVEVRRAGIASGVNNAVARAASLMAIASLPLIVGLSGDEYRSAHAVNHGFHMSVLICAGAMVVSGLIAWFRVPAGVLAKAAEDEQEPSRPCTSCALNAPPVEASERH